MSVALQHHPLADVFPMMRKDDLAELVADIEVNGLIDPIMVYEGKILDGRNRYKACTQIGIEPLVRQWDGKGSPLNFIIAKNLHRRHLNESQRAMVARKIANMRVGGEQANKAITPIGGIATIGSRVSQKKAAQIMNVSPRQISRTATVHKRGIPEVIAAVEQGIIPLNTAELLVATPKKEQKRIIALDGEKLKTELYLLREKDKKYLERQRRKSERHRAPTSRRAENNRIRAETWKQLKEALEGITTLPLPSDVARAAGQFDRSGYVAERLPRALKWLEEFNHEYREDSEDAA